MTDDKKTCVACHSANEPGTTYCAFCGEPMPDEKPAVPDTAAAVVQPCTAIFKRDEKLVEDAKFELDFADFIENYNHSREEALKQEETRKVFDLEVERSATEKEIYRMARRDVIKPIIKLHILPRSWRHDTYDLKEDASNDDGKIRAVF